jgi:hypothetical protein
MKLKTSRMLESGTTLLCLVGLAAFALSANSSSATELSEAQVASAVKTWVRLVTADAKPDAEIDKMEPWIVNGQRVAYIAHLKGGGFCLGGADDLVLPVYLYNPHGKYDPAIPDYNCILEQILTSLENMKRYLVTPPKDREALEKFASSRAAYWQELIAGRVPARSAVKGDEPKSGDPDLMVLPSTDLWDQDSPYNDLCPMLIPGDENTRCKVGCAATSASEIMYYWKWPTTGVTNRSREYEHYYSATWVEQPLTTNPSIPDWDDGLGQGAILRWVSTNGGKLQMKGYWDVSVWEHAVNLSSSTDYRFALSNLFGHTMPPHFDPLSADFGTTYNWSIMRDEHGEPPDAGAAEVAKLCFHAGIAIDVRHGYHRTGGGWSGDALKTYFRYDPDVLPNQSSDPITRISAEIQWFRPVVLEGCGHFWITFGYNKATDPHRQFFMNIGDGGEPRRVWRTLDGSDPAFCTNPGFMIHIAPKDVVKFVGSASSGDGSPADPYRTIATGFAVAQAGATLIFKAGTTHTLPTHPYVISKQLTLKGHDVLIQ